GVRSSSVWPRACSGDAYDKSPACSCWRSSCRSDTVDCETPSPTSPEASASKMRRTWRTTARGSGLVASSAAGPVDLTSDQTRSARLPGARFAAIGADIGASAEEESQDRCHL